MISDNFVGYVIKRFPRLLAFNVLILFLVGMADAVSLLSLAPVVDMLISKDPQHFSIITIRASHIMGLLNLPASFFSFSIVFLAFSMLRSALYLYARYISLDTKYVVLRDIVLGTFKDFFEARWHFFSSSKQGILINTFLREILVVIGDALGTMLLFFTNMLELILYLAIPFCISWRITSVAMTMAVISALPFILLSKMSYGLGKINTSTANEISSVIQENLASAKIVLGFGNQQKSIEGLEKAFDAHRSATLKSQILSNSIPVIYYPIGILILIYILFLAKAFAIPLSEISVICYSFFRVIPSVGRVVEQKNAFSNFSPAYEQMVYFRRRAAELKQSSGKNIFLKFEDAINIEDLYFSYPGHGPCLKDISVRIPRGKMVAFVGESGSGKSTLVDMIMGFNEPTSGIITIDGVKLGEFDINSYRSKVGYLPQDSILFNMTIRDNLLWSNDSATDAEITTACRQANAEEFIKTFPKGYDTIVGDRGVRLSGGQLQRIALARAILRKPYILILDEATSSLDTGSERLIQEAIEHIAKETTVIVIAHRLSTIVNADYIYLLKNGRIIESGRYDQLVGMGGDFSKMVRQQTLETSK